MNKNVRAALRATVGLGTVVGYPLLAAVQGAIVGPLFKDETTLPNLMYQGLKKLFGYKIEFNKASAPLVEDKPTWYVANHTSIADFIVLGATLKGTFGGKGEVMKWPIIAQMAKVVRYMGFRRSCEYNCQSRAKLINNFNEGKNAIMFPEATTTPGKKLALFRSALFSILYGEKGVWKTKDGKIEEVELKQDVRVQPIAIAVKAIDGQDARGNDELREKYAMYNENNTLVRIWKRLQIRETTLELTVFPTLNPRDYATKEDLVNTAAKQIASVINPGQTTFEKAVIPGQKPKPSGNKDPQACACIYTR